MELLLAIAMITWTVGAGCWVLLSTVLTDKTGPVIALMISLKWFFIISLCVAGVFFVLTMALVLWAQAPGYITLITIATIISSAMLASKEIARRQNVNSNE